MSSTGKHRALRLLHLERSELDHAAAVGLMKQAGLAVKALRVDGQVAGRQALERRGANDDPWDLVLSDSRFADGSALSMLEHLRARRPPIPIIVLSSAGDEALAVQAMREGASDYLLKDNLTRLVPAVLRAIERHDQMRAKQATELALLESRQQLRELAQHLQNCLEQERTAIAREIHDEVGGALTALKFDLAWIARHTTSSKVFERTQAAADTLTQAFDATRRLIHNLHPAILEEGLVPALQWIATTFEKRTGIRTSFHSSDVQPQLSGQALLTVFRTAQEALTNVSKHARATQVALDLTFTAGMLSLEVSDNGRGMEQVELNKTQSFGLRGLRERADTAGGWLDISSGPTGTTLILALPLKHKDMAHTEPLASALREVRSKDDPTFWGNL